jgi:flavin reductase (DIM6/NTAB) family NADH-FMN oxidoreductase RutF
MTLAGCTPDAFKAAMRTYASGVTVITVRSADHEPMGMTATAFSSVSADPLLVLICVHGETLTYDRLIRTGYFGINMLAAGSEHISDYCSRPASSKILPPDWLVQDAAWSAPALANSLSFLDCELYRHFPAGTHRVIIGRVRGIGLASGSTVFSDATAQNGSTADSVVGPLVHYQGGYHDLHPAASVQTQEISRMTPSRPGIDQVRTASENVTVAAVAELAS